VELTVVPIRRGDQAIFTSFVRDITERKRAEAEREELLAMLQRERIQSIAADALTDPPFNEFLRWLATRVCDILKVEGATILLVDSEGTLHIRATAGQGKSLREHVHFPLEEGCAEQIANTPPHHPERGPDHRAHSQVTDCGVHGRVLLTHRRDCRVLAPRVEEARLSVSILTAGGRTRLDKKPSCLPESLLPPASAGIRHRVRFPCQARSRPVNSSRWHADCLDQAVSVATVGRRGDARCLGGGYGALRGPPALLCSPGCGGCSLICCWISSDHSPIR
jgi:hypothetical protein